MSLREIKVIDTTLRDGQQCLWATRMTTAMMLPIARRLGEAGYAAIDLMGSIQFDVCVRYLKENPWERIRLMRSRMPDVPFKGGIRSKSLVTFGTLPDDIVHLWIRHLVRTGINKLSFFDALFDFDNLVDGMKVAHEEGAEVGLALVFCESPVHTDELYVRKAQEMMRRVKIDHLMLKDSCGLLTPERTRTLVPALKAVIGDMPLEMHSHCMTGLAPLVYLEGVRAGADVVQTATAPLANGPSQPATQTIVRNLRSMGYTVNLDDRIVEEVSTHLKRVAECEGKPVGVPMEYDAFHYRHQIPGGMLTNLQSQLKAAGLLNRFDDVVHEAVRVREELGYPIMVTPFAQLVVTQALLNVVSGERYKVVPDEMKMYALEHYGKLLAPVHPDVLDRIVANGASTIKPDPPALAPGLDRLRKAYPNATDEERLLHAMFAGSQVDEMLAAGPMQTEYYFDKPIVRLLEELTKHRKLGRILVEDGSTRIELRRVTALSQPTRS